MPRSRAASAAPLARRLGRSEKRAIRQQVLALDRPAHARPVAILAHQGELEPAVVAACGRRWRARCADGRAAAAWATARRQCRLDRVAVGPDAVGEQRARHLGAAARALAVPQRDHDAGGERQPAGAVALRRHRDGRHRVVVAGAVEDAGAREVGGCVEADLVGIRAGLAVAGEGGIDQPRVDLWPRPRSRAAGAPGRREDSW